jgi:hypothetical protein
MKSWQIIAVAIIPYLLEIVIINPKVDLDNHFWKINKEYPENKSNYFYI